MKQDQKDGPNERQVLGKCKIPVCRNVACFAEAYKRRKEFMTELNNRIK